MKFKYKDKVRVIASKNMKIEPINHVKCYGFEAPIEKKLNEIITTVNQIIYKIHKKEFKTFDRRKNNKKKKDYKLGVDICSWEEGGADRYKGLQI